MKRIFWVVFIIFGASLSSNFAQTAADAPQRVNLLTFENFTIESNSKYIREKQFVNKIKEAVLLLKNNCPDDFKMMQTFIGRIRATQISGANYNEEVMTIDIARGTFDSTLPWLTSVLAHETHHIKKYKDSGKKYGGSFEMTDKKAALQAMIDEELECNRVQIEVLKKVGGTKEEIEYLAAQKGDHFDIDKDGDYDWDDYYRRSW
jgi:hypothetical protein